MSKEKVKKKDKWEAYDINKQIISITRQKKGTIIFHLRINLLMCNVI